MHVKLRNERTDEIKDVKVGWSWTLFLFSWFLGLPLFLRKLNTWGGAMLVLCMFFWVLDAFSSDSNEIETLYYVVSAILFGLMIFFGIKGNELTAKNLLENGWKFVSEEDQVTHFARMKWSLS